MRGESQGQPLDYKSAGVDIDAGDRLVEWLKELPPIKTPYTENLVSGIGGFAALFSTNFPEFKEAQDPCLVSSTDGVGTKLSVAVHFGEFGTVGQDLVAMCVNDLLCCGATPLFFLDYYAAGQLRVPEMKSFLAGLREACQTAQVLLIGGETAEMPGVYREGEFDCAGFAVGFVDRPKALGSHRVKVGSRALGVSSTGFHSNGFSLLRRVFGSDLNDWREELLRPTALYTALAKRVNPYIQAMAHITGGGIRNGLRVIPHGTQWNLPSWSWPEGFVEVQKRSGLSDQQMLETLNCGVGLVLFLDPQHEAKVASIVQEEGFSVLDLGEIESGVGEPTIVGWKGS